MAGQWVRPQLEWLTRPRTFIYVIVPYACLWMDSSWLNTCFSSFDYLWVKSAFLWFRPNKSKAWLVYTAKKGETMQDPPCFTRPSTPLYILHQIHLPVTPEHQDATRKTQPTTSAKECLPEQLFPNYHHPSESPPQGIVEQLLLDHFNRHWVGTHQTSKTRPFFTLF